MASSLRAHQMVQNLVAIPAPTVNATRMLELGMDPASTKQQYAEVMSTDPGLALELLRNVGAGEREGVPGLDIEGAVEALDVEFLRRLAFTTCTSAGDGNEIERDQASGMTALRYHSVATASIARALAETDECYRPSEAFAAGMLSAVGELALATLRPAEATSLRQRSAGWTAVHRIEIEGDVHGANSRQIAVAIGEAWDLAVEARQVLLYQACSAGEIDSDCPRQDQVLVSLVRAARLLAARAGYPAFEGLQPSEPEADVSELLESVDTDALTAVGRAAVENIAEVARPKHGGERVRLRNLRVANNELAQLLRRSEHQRQAADSVTKVLHYGLRRLGEGDPLSGLMYLTMESMGFKRISFLEQETRLAVKASSAVRGNDRVEEGRWVPFPTKNSSLGDPIIAQSGDGVPEHEPLLELLGVSSCAIAPLLSKEGKIHGYLAADQGPAGGTPVPGDDRCLGIIADQAFLLLEHERLTQEMQRLATVDPLTGAATRRRLMDRLENLILLSKRTHQPLSLALMDLDHFKKFNDTLGHQAGDRLLQDVVKVLDANTRKTDLVARYGGEEFVVLCPGAELEAAWGLADSLRQAIFDFGVDCAEDYDRMAISISIGVAQLNDDESAMSLIGRADAALYEAKHSGRNRVHKAA